MRILRENTKKVTFAELDEGDVFQFTCGSNCYLKIYKPVTALYNAVNLSRNELVTLEGSSEVIRLDAELNIRG